MKLYFKQKFFSWLDSYDVYDEKGNKVFKVDGKIAIGHKLDIYDRNKEKIGSVREKLIKILPQFDIYVMGEHAGTIKKQLTLLKPKYILDYKDWKVSGDILGFNYSVNEGSKEIMKVNKKLLKLVDTYELNIKDENNALMCLMIVIAIDAANCIYNE